jgi:hypothetical protein
MTVTCVFVRGEYPYTAEWVTRLYAMVARWIDRPFRFVCLTDQPEAFEAPIETVRIAADPRYQAYWAKLELFNPARDWSGRVLYLDLDVLIVAPLAPIIDHPAAFVITDDPPSGHKKPRTHDRFGKQIVRRFNSSVMAWDGGAQTAIYRAWTPAVAEAFSGDQDYLGLECGHAVGLPRAWFPRLSEVQGPPFDPDVKVILTKFPKNDVAVTRFPWFAELWA